MNLSITIFFVIVVEGCKMKRIDLLDKVRDKWLDSGDNLLKVFLTSLRNYYYLSDIETGNQLGKIFESLYLENNTQCYDDIARKFAIDVFTLNRYRRKFNTLANIIVSHKIVEMIQK